ncbi:hypothetical protein [Paraburkholderia sp. WSM4175]|uniref:hypothetical protein n=1 Tax=Paraburkholderia sp. WSM4175 TaxID=2991072 RepID=UPI003D1C1389
MLWQALNPKFFREGYILPQDLTELECSQLSIEMSDAQLQACHQIARLSYGLLESKVSVDASSFWKQVMNFAPGRTLGGIEWSTLRELQAAMSNYFGPAFLRWVGVPDRQDPHVGRRLFGSRSTYSLMPVTIVMLAACCDAMSGENVGKLTFGVKRPRLVIYCMNVGAAHGSRHSVDAIRRRGDHYAAQCTCGAHFKFTQWLGHEASNAEPCGLGRNGRSGKPRSSLGQTVLALRAQGKTLLEIGALLKLDSKTVGNLARMRVKP